MADIYGRDVSNLGGVFAADKAKLVFFGGLLNALVQQFGVSYAQAISRIFELGSSNIYYISGRTQGQATFNRVLGPQSTMCAIYAQFGNVCNARKNSIAFDMAQTDCSTGAAGGGGYDLSLCVIQSVNLSTNASDMIVNEGNAMMFGSLSCRSA